MVVLITGAKGFVGGALSSFLKTSGAYTVRGTARYPKEDDTSSSSLYFGETDGCTDWSHALGQVSCLIHCAAFVHAMGDRSLSDLNRYSKVNVDGTLNLARQAAQAGVRRFIFISSIKVNGESTEPGLPFTACSSHNPIDPYGFSKSEAERGLQLLASETGMDVVIIRPVLVYGPGVKANFLTMMKWINMGVPLPLGSIHNKRSLVALDNLVDLISTCIEHPYAANQTFLVSDGEDLSTTELLQRMGAAMDKPARLIPVPESIIRFGAKLVGKESIAQRLCGSLQVDPQKTYELLGWRPPVSVDDALRATAEHFLKHQGR